MSEQFREVDHLGPAGERIHIVRELIGINLHAILDLLHAEQPLAAGEQWTIPLGMSCGFEGDLIIRVRQAGGCKPRRDGGGS